MTPELGKGIGDGVGQRQENWKFEASLGYIERPCFKKK